MENNHN